MSGRFGSALRFSLCAWAMLGNASAALVINASKSGDQKRGSCITQRLLVRNLCMRCATGEQFDPWRAGQLAQELESERIVVTAFPQTDARMTPASDRLDRAV